MLTIVMVDPDPVQRLTISTLTFTVTLYSVDDEI